MPVDGAAREEVEQALPHHAHRHRATVVSSAPVPARRLTIAPRRSSSGLTMSVISCRILGGVHRLVGEDAPRIELSPCTNRLGSPAPAVERVLGPLGVDGGRRRQCGVGGLRLRQLFNVAAYRPSLPPKKKFTAERSRRPCGRSRAGASRRSRGARTSRRRPRSAAAAPRRRDQRGAARTRPSPGA